MEDQVALALFLREEFGLQAGTHPSIEELEKLLALHINTLIPNQFDKLVNLLYRIDVDESRLRGMLASNPGLNAGDLIARLIVERQLQKIATKNEGSRYPGNIPEDDKW